MDWSGSTPVVYATTSEAVTTQNRLIKINDTGAGSPATTLAAAGASRAFRGVAFAPVAKENFFTSPNLPPPEGKYVSPQQYHVLYAQGIIIKNISHQRFTQSQPPPPPPPGTVQVHAFSSTVEMDVSNDGGVNFQRLSAPAQVQVRVTYGSEGGGTSYYDTEMLQLDLSGGGLPAGVMVRESPTLPSKGKTSVRQAAGGFMIDSFFDIFTELSVDGGQNWSPAQGSAHVDLRGDPLAVPPIPAPTSLLPPPNDLYVTPADFHAAYAQGIVIRDIKHHFFTDSLPPPPPGGSQTHNFGSQVDMQVSTDGGASFQPMRAPASVGVMVTHRSSFGGTDVYDTEMLSLNLQGGDLPPGVMIRESPTRRSEGGTAITGDPDFDLLRIGSFFDVFTELSVDGGQNWAPANSAAHVVLECHAPERPEPSPNLPPPGGEYVSPADFHAAYAAGIIIKDVRHNGFTQSQPPPPPGGTQPHQFDSQVHFMVSMDGGATFSPASAPAHAVVRVTSTQDEGPTRFFETEMLALDIAGGSCRRGDDSRKPDESFLGRTSIRMVNSPTGIGIYQQLLRHLHRADSGWRQTWQPSTTVPSASGPWARPLGITCPLRCQ